MNQCRKKDREMEEYRKGKGKGGKGGYGGFGGYGKSQGKGGYQPKGWHKGGWPKGGGKGGFKGKGSAYGLGWGEPNAPWDQGSPNPWTLNVLTKAEPVEAWLAPKRPCKPMKAQNAMTMKAHNVSPPPGLTRGFEILTMDEAKEEFWGQSENKYEEEFPKAMKASVMKANKMPPMKNYSKRQVRAIGNEGPKRVWKAKDERPKQCMILTKAVPATKTLSPFLAPTPDKEGWVRVKGVMDSGASESVAPPSLCPHYDISPSAGSIAGQHYMSAGEELIPNLGQQTLDIVTDSGNDSQVRYQMAEISRPLNAVSEICDAGGAEGQHVLFTKWGGIIYNLESGQKTYFQREDGVYTLDFWVKPKGFQWPGR